MKFAKTLMAAALFASAGAASASIGNSGTADSGYEAYLSVYDSVQAKTFDLDLGITLADLIANVSNAAYTKSFDLSSYANWNTFAANLNPGSTVYSIAAGRSSKFVVTLSNPISNPNGTAGVAIATAIKNHAGEINVGTSVNVAENNSKLVADSDTPATGQYNNFDSIFDTAASLGAHASIAYGNNAAFWYVFGSNTTTAQINQQFAGVWNLSGNTLSLAPAQTSAVPLPAAVWMFGAGLMGVLRLNRRKSVEA